MIVRMIKLFCMSVCVVFYSQDLYAWPWTRHDFEVWNLKTQKRILLADTDVGGLRETPFQYDYSSKVLYTHQGMLDEKKARIKSMIIRAYNLDSGAVRRFPVPVERYGGHWRGVVIDNKLLLMGCENSLTNCLHRGRGNKLLVLDLNPCSDNRVIAEVNLGERRVIYTIVRLSEFDFCIGGFDLERELFFIENYDGRKLSLKKHIDFPAEWGEDYYDKEKLRWELSEFSIYLHSPVEINVSPTRSMLMLKHDWDLWLFDEQLERVWHKNLRSNEFVSSKVKGWYPHLTWVDQDDFVLYSCGSGLWVEYDVSDKMVKKRGRISLKKKDADRLEQLSEVVGRRRFYLCGDVGFLGSFNRRICFVDEGGVERTLRKVSGMPVSLYCPPDIVVLDRL